MSNKLYDKIIQDTLFKPAELDQQQLQTVFLNMLDHQIEFADLYLQHTMSESWVLEDSQIKRGSFSIERGTGIRVIKGDKTGFAYCDDIAIAPIQQALSAAKSIAHQGSSTPSIAIPKMQSSRIYQPVNPIANLLNRL